MKLTFAYDGVLYQDSYGHWYGRNYTSLSERYYILSDDITYLMRTRFDEKAAEKMNQMPPNAKVISVPDIMSLKNSLINSKKANQIIKSQIKATDCVIVRMPGMLSRIAIKYAKKYGKPYIVEVVGCVWDSLIHHSLKGVFLAPIEFFKTKKAIYYSPYVMYVTNEFLQRRYPNKGKSIGISDVQLEALDIDTFLYRYNKEINKKDIIIGTAGSVDVKYKGQQYVIQAISKLLVNSDKNYIYHIAGGGDNTRLQQLAKKYNVDKNVIFDGSIPNDIMKKWYDSLDIYIQPSTVEGMPRALLEAMSRCIVCFGSDVGGIPELLPKKCIFEKKNVEEIAYLIDNLDIKKRKEYIKWNYDKSREFDLVELKKKRDQFYNEFMNNQGG